MFALFTLLFSIFEHVFIHKEIRQHTTYYDFVVNTKFKRKRKIVTSMKI
jgi:hypothetical protein